MEDMLEKMGTLLSDPESLQQLSELAQMLQQGCADETQDATPKPSAPTPQKTDSSGFDASMLLKLQELMSAMQRTDADAEFLLALRPHLKERRQKKVDQAVKLLKLYAVYSAAKESGMLQDFLTEGNW